jgi:hypothetical protein
MNRGRAAVLAVSNSEQQRETLVIMLDEVFDVRAALSPLDPPSRPAPAAVVLAPAPWDDDLVRQTRDRWPHAGLVAVDPPPDAPRARECAAASWSDPFSLPLAVAEAARAEGDATAADGDLVATLRRAGDTLRSPFAQAESLAALAACAARPHSVEIAAQLLREHVRNLLDLLAWVEWFEEDESEDSGSADLAAALRHALEERCRRRGRRLSWSSDLPCPVATTAARAASLARCLGGALLALPAGALSVDAAGGRLSCSHAAIDANFAVHLPVAAAGRLLARAGARLEARGGALTVRIDHDADHA